MDQLPQLGRSIWEVIPKTSEIYASLLNRSSKDAILGSSLEVASYGPDPRQKLDVYGAESSTAPILVFLYGGAWVEGDRVIGSIPGGLVYRNLGYYFAKKQGFETIIPDYRLVRHGARYPAGSEDLALVLRYVRERYGTDRPLFVLGNSAGGVNTMSWLLDDAFHQSRETSKVTGLISLGALMDFDHLPPPFPDLLLQYFEEGYTARSPIALLRSAALKGQLKKGWPALLILWSELDPDVIVETNNDFVAELRKHGVTTDAEVIMGHNHISPPMSLGTGLKSEEEWGASVAAWARQHVNRT
ncbi:alpha/beta hydrolase [Fonsecaea pedrosoi]|nr:alpha/beta hydrolase [Fonsecaea pedrosoi]